MDDENQQLIEKYRSYCDKLKNGFPTKEYAGSVLIAINKTPFCNNENGNCRFIGQESVNEKPEPQKQEPEAAPVSISTEVLKDFYEINNMLSATNSPNSLIHPYMHHMSPTPANFQLLNWPSGHLSNIQSMPNMPNMPSMSNLPNSSHFMANAFKGQPSFQRFSNVNRSLRFPAKNNSFYFKSY